MLLFTILDNGINHYHFCEYNLKHRIDTKRLVLIIVIGKCDWLCENPPVMNVHVRALSSIIIITNGNDNLFFKRVQRSEFNFSIIHRSTLPLTKQPNPTS